MEPTELLTWDEICARFPDRWVGLIDVTFIDDEAIATARVLHHAKHIPFSRSVWPSTVERYTGDEYHVHVGIRRASRIHLRSR